VRRVARLLLLRKSRVASRRDLFKRRLPRERTFSKIGEGLTLVPNFAIYRAMEARDDPLNDALQQLTKNMVWRRYRNSKSGAAWAL
jgi:hypothetical protein